MSSKILRTTVTGSYPRPQQPGDTLRKPALSREQADELIRWAVTDQVDAGLDVVTDGEGRRENMYYFFQKRLEGVSFAEMEYRKYGPLGFGIEIAKVVSRLENPHFELARDWRVARDAAPAHVEVKLTCTGPHMLAKFSNNARTDLYPTDRHLAEAYAALLNDQLKEAVRAGCELIQFDEPAWTAFPEESVWAAEVLNQASAGLGVKNRLARLLRQRLSQARLHYPLPGSGGCIPRGPARPGVPGTLHPQLRHDDAVGHVGFQG